ncbi:N-myristoyl transferase [Cutaneotrichosporon oleaginosum]|uniref:Glycylpeptide N-tetradecanoyltransferase n=1 Tax=Cutaneotrichosporon oleaginosum TaxID=879819 RepID=A0A0J0XKD0_9TREE|nr:N-myristoyl transferase [Cutaneotrichosporon oleaginosum]KLT41550.1 N-myristoyl transferase [Cutaneotrichosporon oleaginosum]TXT09317.1 hypothetical protein COLE_03251 [Cutaneotrichosporon oleaginosum]
MAGEAGAPGSSLSRSGGKSIAELLDDTLVSQLEDTHIDDEDDTDDGEAKKKKKKKKKKSKAKAPVVKEVTADELVNIVRGNMSTTQSAGASNDDIRKALQAADLMKLLEGHLGGPQAAAEHKFWKTQPVPQKEEDQVKEGAIDEHKTPADVQQDPIALPTGFVWSIVDVKQDEEIDEVHNLLTENYVEDDDAMFRFRYSREFLLWALTPPGYYKDWHIGVRVQKTGKLVGFISGIPVELRVRNNTFMNAEINFLCVHKKLRSKRLAPVLIKEVTRRVNLQNIWQAIYTAGVRIPTPFSTCRYYHRSLNPAKLVDIGFSPLRKGETIARLVRKYNPGEQTKTPGFREMVSADVPQVAALLRRYLGRFDCAQLFNTDEDVEHWFISGMGKEVNGKRENQVVWAYVVEDPTTNLITDVVSFYTLPSTIMQHPKYDCLNAAYMFYYASDVVFAPGASSDDAFTHDLKTQNLLDRRLNALVTDLLVMAKKHDFDVVNALTLLDNNVFLEEQMFGRGDGALVRGSREDLKLLLTSNSTWLYRILLTNGTDCSD